MCVALWLRPFFVPLRECSVCSLQGFFCCVRCYRFFAFFFFFFLHHLYTSDTRSFPIVSKKFRGPFLSNINTFFLSLFGKKKKSPMIFPPKPWVIFKIYIHTRIDPLTPRSHIDFFCVIKYVEMIFFFLSFAWWSAIERSHHIIDLNPGSSGSPHDVHWCPWVFCPPINRSYVTCSFLSVISLHWYAQLGSLSLSGTLWEPLFLSDEFEHKSGGICRTWTGGCVCKYLGDFPWALSILSWNIFLNHFKRHSAAVAWLARQAGRWDRFGSPERPCTKS